MRSNDLVSELFGTLVVDGSADPVGSALPLWAASGGLALTGHPHGPPTLGGAGAAAVAATLLGIWSSGSAARLGHAAEPLDVGLLGERAALAGLSRRGRVSCGGGAHLVTALGGQVALSLARPADIELVPALVGRDLSPATAAEAWPLVEAWAATALSEDVVERARLLGLPAATLPPADAARPRPAVVVHEGPTRPRKDRPRVVDLSALWAGPLCAHLLGLAGADVVKVESVHRPDGARRSSSFYDLLHGGHRSVGLDFADSRELEALRRLVLSADVVIEASRPRALRRLGIDAEEGVASGATWISITAYGREGDAADLVGFGDDVAAGAGLVAGDLGRPVFCGDAIADPLTGLLAAVACLNSLSGDRAQLLDVAMHRVAAVAAAVPQEEATVVADGDRWFLLSHDGLDPVATPRARRPRTAAAPLGAHTDEVAGRWLR